MMKSILHSLKFGLWLNVILIISLTFGTFGLTHVQKAFAGNVKSLTIVEDNIIRAGDIFDGLDRNQDRAVGMAPLPGKDMVLNARTLLRIAMALDVSWRPIDGSETVVIRRAATVIDQNMIETAIQNELSAKGHSDTYKLSFLNNDASIILPKDSAKTVHIGSFEFDSVSNQFTAEILAPSLENPIKRQLVSGKAERITKVPVLKHTTQSGQLITVSNIEWIDMPAYKLQHDFVLNSESLIGMTPRRIALAGQPLRLKDINEPLLVKRGDNVAITYSAGPVQLTAEGKALQNGARGDVIRVVNYSSNRTIDAFITGARNVEVN